MPCITSPLSLCQTAFWDHTSLNLLVNSPVQASSVETTPLSGCVMTLNRQPAWGQGAIRYMVPVGGKPIDSLKRGL